MFACGVVPLFIYIFCIVELHYHILTKNLKDDRQSYLSQLYSVIEAVLFSLMSFTVTHLMDFESDFGGGSNGSPTPGSEVVIGQVGGVATDKLGNVYVFHRGERVWNGL